MTVCNNIGIFVYPGGETMDNKNKLVGANLKALRKAFGYTQVELATVLGINDRETISFYENGERKIPLAHLNRLADLFNVELAVLFSDDLTDQKLHKAFAFRKEELKEKDLLVLAEFNRIVKSYIKIARLEKKHGIQP